MTAAVEEAKKLGWMFSPPGKFGRNDPSDEFLHPVAADAPHALVETYWWAFCDPRSGMSGSFYTQMRRALGVCAAGVWIYSGPGANPLRIDHFNWQVGLPPHVVDGNILSAPAIGLEFEIVEPFSAAKVRYRPSGGAVEAELEFTALAPPVTTASQEHFDQAVWCRGHVMIDGRRVELDAPGFRDRTWDAARSEDPLDHPPISYLWGVLDGGGINFALRGSEDPDGAPWAKHYGLDKEQLFRGGFIQIDGKLRSIDGMSMNITRDTAPIDRPRIIDLTFTDDASVLHHLVGTARSSMYFNPFPNILAWFVFLDWKLDGRFVGVGEIQEVYWAPYCKRFWPRSA